MANQDSNLPPGWLSTKQAAEVLGMTRRQLQEYTRTHPIARVQLTEHLGKPCYYDPQVIEQVRLHRESAGSSKATDVNSLGVKAEGEKPGSGGKDKSDAAQVVETAPPDAVRKARPAKRQGDPKPNPVPLTDKQVLLHDLLQCAKANTAMLDRIAQNIGRMG